MPDYTLFRRQYQLQVGELSINALRIEFNVKKSLSKASSKADIKIYNLNAKSRARLVEKAQQDPVVLLAGYEGQGAEDAVQIFTGNVDRLIHFSDGTEYVTHIKAIDGMSTKNMVSTGVAIKDTSAADIIRELLKRIKVDKGNFEDFMKGRDPKKMSQFVATKKPEDSIAELTSSLGGEFTIADGKAHFVGLGSLSGDSLVVLDYRTGLIGSPDIGKKNFIVAKALIQPGFIIGHGIKIKAEDKISTYRIESVTYTGDMDGGTWFASLELSLTDGNKVIGDPDDDKPISSTETPP